MCGIAGYAGSQPLDRDAIDRSLALMQRRGPDAAASCHWQRPGGGHAYLLHTRLQIIDLDPRSDQPFRDGSKWLAYNGELYNYLEIRDELKAACGAPFRTESDTEVLLRAIDMFGWDSLDRCEGMWAFAIYDERDGSISLCRDRFGEKPLYVYRDATGVYFGSEVKFITALRGERPAVNYDHLYRYLVNGYKALCKEPHEFFQGIEAVPPASVVTLHADGSESRRVYWQPRFAPDSAMSYDDAVAGTRERVLRSVKLRLRADVPLAFCMSGGIDSNALIATAKNVFGYDVHGFTIVNEDERYEEQDMIDCAVRELGLRHTAIPARTENFLPKLRCLVRQHDSPVATITYFAHWTLMEAVAAHGYRIAISGTAADEIFTGYYDHHLAYLYEVRGDAPRHASAKAEWAAGIGRFVRNPFLQDADAFIRNPAMRDHIFLDAEAFAGYLIPAWAEPFAERALADDLLRNRMLNELTHENVPVILHEDDLNAMYYSIENRSPFLDRDLVDFAFAIPTEHLIQHGLAKAVLRDAMRGIVPAAILDNPRKVGFNAPIFSYMSPSDPDTRAALLDDSPIFDIVHRERIEALLTRATLPNSESKFLFYFLNAKMFVEEFAR
jgi:asparagine synthase (glutamine-hydrolysing)